MSENIKPVAWVRRHPDGALTAEFKEDAAIEPVRKESGALVPLFTLSKLDQARREERQELITQIEVMRSHIWPYHDECCKTTAHNVIDNIIKSIRARSDA